MLLIGQAQRLIQQGNFGPAQTLISAGVSPEFFTPGAVTAAAQARASPGLLDRSGPVVALAALALGVPAIVPAAVATVAAATRSPLTRRPPFSTNLSPSKTRRPSTYLVIRRSSSGTRLALFRSLASGLLS